MSCRWYILSMKKAHIIGIAGVGMSATAILLKESGWEVTGSDDGAYPPITTYLDDVGIPYHVGYRPENIPPGVTLFVIGKNAKLDADSNTEVASARASGVPIQSFPEVLGELSRDTKNIVVAGSYGKSTATALLAWCLEYAKKDPSYFIGAIPIGMTRTSHKGASDIFVLEGDEYPSSHTDSRSKFLHLHAHDVLLTSLVHDHFNVFPTEESYLAPFYLLTNNLPSDGLLVAMGEDANIQNLLASHQKRAVTYSRENPSTHWYAQHITYGEVTSFDLYSKGSLITKLSTVMLGKHNVENIVGVAAMLLEKKLVTPQELQDAVSAFKGVVRRLDRKDTQSAIPVYEGFGSSYEKAKAAIAAMKLHYPERKLLIVFEPHTFTWRNRDGLRYYDDVFRDAEEVLIYEPASQGSTTHNQLTHQEIIDRVLRSGTRARGITSRDEGMRELERIITREYCILLLTSGNLAGLIEDIPQFVDSHFKK